MNKTRLAALLVPVLALAACAPAAKVEATKPLVIAHRGLPGRYPEETRSAYEAAAKAGADALELDVHLSRDCVPVARHNPWLSDNTDIAATAARVPEVAARRRTVPGRWVDVGYDATRVGGPSRYLVDLTDPADPKSVLKSLIVDGEDHSNDWSITDFTVAELRRWVRGTTYDNRDERPKDRNGTEPVLTFQEVIDIARAHGLIVYPETKNPTWNNAQAIANGCGAPGSHPLEDALLKVLEQNGLNHREAPVLVQSFEPASLKYLRAAGLRTRTVQLMDGNGVDYRTGAVILMTPNERAIADGRPYSWTLAGDARTFADMLTPAGLAEVKTYADGIGPWKPYLMSWRIVPAPQQGKGTLAQVNSVTPTLVIADAHAAGLFVHSFTFRDERRYLPGLYDGDAQAELVQYLRAGVDGVFSDFADTAVTARTGWLRESRR